MKIRSNLINAINVRNRTVINNEYRLIYDKYFILVFYTAFRMLQNKNEAVKISNEVFSIFFKNITDIEDIDIDLFGLTYNIAKKRLDAIDKLDNEYEVLLEKYNITDDSLNLYICCYKYNVNSKYVLKYKSKKYRKTSLNYAILCLNDVNVDDFFDCSIDYDSISNKIELTQKKFFIREKKFLTTGIVFLGISIILFVIAFIISATSKVNNSISTNLFYFALLSGVLVIVMFIISSRINKHNK